MYLEKKYILKKNKEIRNILQRYIIFGHTKTIPKQNILVKIILKIDFFLHSVKCNLCEANNRFE